VEKFFPNEANTVDSFANPNAFVPVSVPPCGNTDHCPGARTRHPYHDPGHHNKYTPPSSGGSGAYGGGNCKEGTPSASSHACAVRQHRIDDLTGDYWIKTVIGSVLIALSDGMNFFNDTGPLAKLEDLADLLSTLLQGIIPGVGWLLENRTQFLGAYAAIFSGAFQAAESLESVIQKALGVVNGFIQAFKAGNFLQRWAAEASVIGFDGVVTIAMGPASLLKQAVVALAAGLIDMGGHWFLSQASDDQADIARISAMDIGQWCQVDVPGQC
jgi:hypothetical protein